MAGFIPPARDVADAHFYVAVCSFRARQIPFFSDVSSTHNLLRDRERHIRGLQGELAEAQRQYAALEESQQRESQRLSSELASLQAQLRAFETQQEQIRRSAWMRLGRILGVGPWSDYRARAKNFLHRRADDTQRVMRNLASAVRAVV